MRVRRSSTMAGIPAPIPSPSATRPIVGRLRTSQTATPVNEEAGYHWGHEETSNIWDERSPLLAGAMKRTQTGPSSYGAGDSRSGRPRSHGADSASSKPATSTFGRYDINNPPSVPNSPNFGGVDRLEAAFGDVMIRDDLDLHNDHPMRSLDDDDHMSDAGGALRDNRPDQARRMVTSAEEDVCFPAPGMSEMGDDEAHHRGQGGHTRTRRRRGQWPDLGTLEEWMHMEKEDRSDERRVKKITEPQLINGRLRPIRKGWFESDEDAPYRFTYFNEEFQSTIHAQTISELVQPGGGFRELFIPEPRVLSDDETDDEDETAPVAAKSQRSSQGIDPDSSRLSTRQPSISDSRREGTLSPSKDAALAESSGRGTPCEVKPPEDGTQKSTPVATPEVKAKVVRYGERPTWWLDVLCPTEAEMKVISKAFGIHPLTSEDIMLQEAREKVELFRHYYFVNYRTFDQDINSENYLEPVNMYVVVFREGVLSFHFSVSPHPANVRRRIRQLRDYLILSSDWISYAIIDDITDVFQPLIQNIEDEVDEIDEAILQLHSVADKRLKDDKIVSASGDDTTTLADSSGDMLRRVGDCRKRVMGLYRLLGNKADVIKGFAKRCNERWEVAPRSEIGLYLGDIQDHIVTMTSNLGHYEKYVSISIICPSRAFANKSAEFWLDRMATTLPKLTSV